MYVVLSDEIDKLKRKVIVSIDHYVMKTRSIEDKIYNGINETK